MTDAVFKEKILQVEKDCLSSNFGEAIKILEELRSTLLPNDLAAYLSVKSLIEDIGANKNQDFIRKDINELKCKILNLRLSKSEKISNFAISIASYTLIPVIPFVANYLNNEANTNKDIVLSSAMYGISIALSLKSVKNRVFCILFSITILLLVNKEPTQRAVFGTFFLATIIVLIHLFDRIDRHLKNNEYFI